MLAVGGLATGTAAAFVAVLAGFGAEPVGGVAAAQATLTSRTVSFGSARVQVQRLPSGTVCFRVTESAGSSRACRASVGAREIGYTISPRGIGGVAGPQVRAVIVKLTRLGTVWARADRGAFYADVPPAYRVRAVVKVLRDGSRKTFAVKGPDA